MQHTARRRSNLHRSLLNLHLGQELAFVDVIAIAHEPRRDDPFDIWTIGENLGKVDLDAQETIFRTASLIRALVGSTAYSSECA